MKRKFMRWRYNVKTELVLAFLPTITVVIVLILVEAFSHQRLLFSSLAASAFLIYLDPKHQMNRIRNIAVSQTCSALIGFMIYLIAGPGYIAAATAMIIAITAMILLRSMHPPAVSTALSFAFREGQGSTLFLFLMALVILVLLIVLQRASLWLIRKDKPPKEEHIK